MIRSDSEFLQFALSRYDNPQLAFIEEFESDLKRFTYINNLINRYVLDRLDLKEKLIVNHLIILGNCFSVPGLLKMIRYKISDQNIPIIETFLYFLNIIESTESDLDFYLLDILNEQ